VNGSFCRDTYNGAREIRSDAVKMSIEFEQEIEKLREENLSLRNIIKRINDNPEINLKNTVEIQSKKSN